MHEMGEGWARWLLVGAWVLTGCGSRSALEEYFSAGVPEATGAAGVGASGGFGAGGSSGGGGTSGSGGGFISGGGGRPPGRRPDPRLDPPTFCTWDGWCGSNADFVAITGTSDTDIWILANDTGSLRDAGSPADPNTPISAEPVRTALLHWDGISWMAMQPDPALLPPGIPLRDIAAASPTDLWAVGEAATVLTYDWTKMEAVPGPFEGTLTTVEARDPWDVWVGGSADSVWNFLDGVQWNAHPLYTSGGVTSVSRAPESVWLVGYNLLGPVDGFLGDTNAHGLTSIWHDDDKTVFGAGIAGALGRWHKGEGWAYESDLGFGGIDFRAVWGRSGTDVWAVGEAGALAHFDGLNWLKMTPGTARDLNGVWGTSSGTWAVGDDGTFLSLEDDGWTSSETTTGSLRALWGAAVDDVWAVGDDVIHWNGLTWDAISHPDVPELLAISGAASSDVWAVGSAGTILHWDGAAWSNVPSPTPANINGVWSHRADDAWAVTQSGEILHFDGMTWSVKYPASDLLAPMAAVAGNEAGKVLAVGRERVIQVDDVWGSTAHPSGVPTYTVAFGSGTDVWMGGSIDSSDEQAGGQRPVLSLFPDVAGASTFTDGLEPDAITYGLSNNTVVAGWAGGPDDVWIALPSVMHWDGETWDYSSVGGSEEVVALYGVGQDLWAITAEGNLVRRGFNLAR